WLEVLDPGPGYDLDPQIPVPEVTVTRKATSPGELLLDVFDISVYSNDDTQMTRPLIEFSQLTVPLRGGGGVEEGRREVAGGRGRPGHERAGTGPGPAMPA